MSIEAKNPANFLGIEIGGTKLQLFVSDADLNVLEKKRTTVEREAGANGICEKIAATISTLSREYKISAVGVGFGGPVDWRTGRICRSHQIEGWSEFELADWLGKLTGAPVFADNDANVGALGEAVFGAGKNANPVFYITLGSGVGGGLVADGKIYHGATPGEAEIGHVRLDRAGTTVESRCSGWAVDARIRALKLTDPASVLAKLSEGDAGGEAMHLAVALAQNDFAAQRILREVAEDLAFGLSHVAHLFHPETIVIGGGLANVGEPLRIAVASALKTFVMGVFAPGPKIYLAALQADAVPLGALELARRGFRARS